ncbi:unnamed protein product [Sphagnum compactum]
MKKRSREDDASWICDLGSEWMSKRRKISRVDDEDGGGISEVGLQWMSSRPSLRKANGCSRSASDASKSLLPAQNLDHGERWRCSRTESRQNVKTRVWKKQQQQEEEEEDGNWISDMGSAWMQRRKRHSTGNGSIAELGSELMQRKRTYADDALDDDSWVADVGYRWMSRQRKSRNHNRNQMCRSELEESAWICELGFQWMSRRKEREALNGAWLSDLSSLYMSRKKSGQDDNWISELGADWMSRKKSIRDDEFMAVLDPEWDPRRKLEFGTPNQGHTGLQNGKSRHFEGLESFNASRRSGFEGIGASGAHVEGLGSSSVEFRRPAMYVSLDSASSS